MGNPALESASPNCEVAPRASACSRVDHFGSRLYSSKTGMSDGQISIPISDFPILSLPFLKSDAVQQGPGRTDYSTILATTSNHTLFVKHVSHNRINSVLNRSITCALEINQYFAGISGKIGSSMSTKYDLSGRGDLREQIRNAKGFGWSDRKIPDR